ncbi:MAG: hypothetical protein HKN16_04695 [Saprospiraceae bacterium]|nr:hypothetical protein [Saprospiraceae bacterium]
MKGWLLAIVYIVLIVALSKIIPWWSVAVIGVILGVLFKGSGWQALFWGFVAGSLSWLGQSFYLSNLNEHLLLGKVAGIFGDMNPFILLVLVGVIGGITAGLSFLTGNQARKIVDQGKP